MENEDGAVTVYHYDETAKPPFVVYVWDASDSNVICNLGNLHTKNLYEDNMPVNWCWLRERVLKD